jgi:hypothetical protein
MCITPQILDNVKRTFITKDLVLSRIFGELLILIQEK